MMIQSIYQALSRVEPPAFSRQQRVYAVMAIFCASVSLLDLASCRSWLRGCSPDVEGVSVNCVLRGGKFFSCFLLSTQALNVFSVFVLYKTLRVTQRVVEIIDTHLSTPSGVDLGEEKE